MERKLNHFIHKSGMIIPKYDYGKSNLVLPSQIYLLLRPDNKLL